MSVACAAMIVLGGSREWHENSVGSLKMRLAIREIRDAILDFRIMPVLAILSALLAFAAPFGTSGFLSLPEGLVYWTLIVLAGYLSGRLINAAPSCWPFTARSNISPYLRLNGVWIGVFMSLWITSQNWLWFRYVPPGDELIYFYARIVFVAYLVEFGVMVIRGYIARQSIAPKQERNVFLVPILARVPMEKRGKLLALSAEDHYVRVITDKGDALVLIRLRDAIGEVGATEGLQIHRSHWVAKAAIAAARRVADRAEITLCTGDTLSVSRSKLATLRAHCLLL